LVRVDRHVAGPLVRDGEWLADVESFQELRIHRRARSSVVVDLELSPVGVLGRALLLLCFRPGRRLRGIRRPVNSENVVTVLFRPLFAPFWSLGLFTERLPNLFESYLFQWVHMNRPKATTTIPTALQQTKSRTLNSFSVPSSILIFICHDS